MGFHEAMHAFTSHWLGDTTASDMGRLTLNPLKHIDIVMTVLLPVMLIALGVPPIFAAKPVPFNPDRVKFDEFGAALIGIAGPLTNLLLAIAAAGLYRLLLPSGLTQVVLEIFIVINCSFFVFNMIPFPPLDGSRLLYALAPEPLQKLMYQIETMGIGFTILILIFLLPVIGPFISYGVNGLVNILL
jgi:Zn-dependent protease